MTTVDGLAALLLAYDSVLLGLRDLRILDGHTAESTGERGDRTTGQPLIPSRLSAGRRTVRGTLGRSPPS